MNRKLIKRLSLDLVMTAVILLAFAYPLTGNTLHELIGIAMLVLVVVHARWNWKWFLTLLKGKYNGFRRVSVTVNLLLATAALMMMLSGLLNSNLLFSVLNIEFDLLTREFHTAAAYWFLILMAIHLGMHWKMIMAEARSVAGVSGGNRFRAVVLRAILLAVVAHGIYASFERSVLSKLAAYYSFDHWDFDESIIGFFAQYLSIVGLYACLAYYALQLHKNRKFSFSLIRTGIRSVIGGFCRKKCGGRN